MNRANGANSLGLRPPDPPEARELEIVLPASAWKRVDDDARTFGLSAADAISQIIADMCWQANAPTARGPAQPRQRKPRAARTE
jgi:hypothetical protein